MAGRGREPVTLVDVLARGDRRTAEAWSTTEGAIEALKGELDGSARAELPPGMHTRDALDTLRGATVVLAGARPSEFLAAFDEPAWHRDSFVLSGLRAIDRPRATTILVAALDDPSGFTRMDAVISLQNQHDRRAAPALAGALDDPEYLVRYHALAGLCAHGDPRTEAALVAFDERTDVGEVEHDMARAALRAVRRSRRARG